MRRLGRGLQVCALFLLPIAVFLELAGGLNRSFHLADLLKMLVFGVVLFTIGRMIEGYGAERTSTSRK